MTESYLNSFNNISDYSVSNNNCRIPKLISRINFDQINFKITIPVETGLLKNSPTTSLTDESIFDLGHFQLNRPLYPYQINNIKWMAQLENNIKLGKLNISSFERTAQNQLVFYLDNLKRYQVLVNLGIPVSENKPVETCQFTPKGGVLADHVGLGKTSSFIGLMAFQKLKRGNLGHKVSLVICPRRLCYQWLAEINLISDLNADIISNINQFRRVCETGIDKVDILILSYSFLNNLNYLNYLDKNVNNPNHFNIHNYHWERIILDEGHEYINQSIIRKRKEPNFVKQQLYNLKSDYRWICSGTPYADMADFWSIIRFLCPTDKDLFKNIWKISHIKNLFVNTLFRKQTQESIQNQVTIPGYHNETTFLKFSDIEQAIYDSVNGDTEKMIQLCNHVLISEHHINILGHKPLSLPEIHQKMTDYYGKKVTKTKSQLLLLEKNLAKVNITPPKKLELQTKQDEVTKRLKNFQSKFNLFNAIMEKAIDQDCCPICLDKLSETTKVVTNCGHIMCMTCTSKLFKGNWNNQMKCPICREEIIGKSLEIIKDNGDHDDLEMVTTSPIKTIDKWGTKMANLLLYLQQILSNYQLNNRVIVFSQWNNMLKMVGNVLEENGVKYLYLQGSIHVVTSRINKFKSDHSIRVVLLSSDRAVSGLNLTEATHIILLDTLNTTPEKARQIEEQAIGRAVRIGQDKNVVIKRFIMESTIEHDYYLKNMNTQVAV